jgi:DNA (cytosine-5)-methyltransferase 1
MTAYYNEHDPYAAQWLRNLIAAGHIAPGKVDERSIEDVRPSDLAGFTQCHFFAGIGVWSHALRRAGWPDSRPIWTGSCPCQPFSAAGKGAGFSDERHLWPAWYHLITQCNPNVIMGEQVASADGLGWLDLVLTDLEAAGYARGAVDLCAAGVGAPHIRQRSWFVAERLANTAYDRLRGSEAREVKARFATGRDVERSGTDKCGEFPSGFEGPGTELFSGMADMQYEGSQGGIRGWEDSGWQDQHGYAGCDGTTCPTNSFWRDADWLSCRDGKWRPVESGTFPLAHGITNRVGRLRAFGNAINAEAATAVIRAYM